MKNLKFLIFSLLTLVLTLGCQEDDLEFGDVVAPTNISITVTYLDDTDDDGIAEETSAPGLGSGEVKIEVAADNAISYQVVVQGQTKVQTGGGVSHIFATLGNNTYPITVIAFGPGGVSSSQTIEIDVLSLYEPPAELLEMLYGDGERTWRIKSEAQDHFGLGPAGGNPFSFFGAPPESKAGVGMYDDRYKFNEDGTFTHITDSTNDDPTVDTSGTVFGRENLINELNGPPPPEAGSDGADILNYPFADYSETHSLSAPGGVETITISGIGFIGYYVGGNHQYKILSRSANEMVIKTTDGNSEFDWGFTLIAED